MTEIRIACAPCSFITRTLEQLSGERPAILVAFPYLPRFLTLITSRLGIYRTLAVDSGAFSVKNSGKTVDLDDFIAKMKALRATMIYKISDIFALDVIGDWRKGLANAEKMTEAGVPCVPCYHYGEPEEVLLKISREYPKIAISPWKLSFQLHKILRIP